MPRITRFKTDLAGWRYPAGWDAHKSTGKGPGWAGWGSAPGPAQLACSFILRYVGVPLQFRAPTAVRLVRKSDTRSIRGVLDTCLPLPTRRLLIRCQPQLTVGSWWLRIRQRARRKLPARQQTTSTSRSSRTQYRSFVNRRSRTVSAASCRMFRFTFRQSRRFFRRVFGRSTG